MGEALQTAEKASSVYIPPKLQQRTKMHCDQVGIDAFVRCFRRAINAGCDQHRLHPNLLCAADVGVEPIADHERVRWREIELRQRRSEEPAPRLADHGWCNAGRCGQRRQCDACFRRQPGPESG